MEGLTKPHLPYQLWDEQLFDILGGRLDKNATVFYSFKNIDRPEECGVNTDNSVGMVDVRRLANFLFIESQQGGNWSATPFKSKGRNCLDKIALLDQGLC